MKGSNMAIGGNVLVNNRLAVAKHLREAEERVRTNQYPIDLDDPAYWRWVFGPLPEIIDFLTKE
jgi:hypothetical protein